MITSFPPATATVGVKFDYTVKVSEPDGDKVIFSVLKGPKSMTVDADGKVSWTPSYDEVGNQEVEIQVTDGKYGGKTTQQFTVVVETVKPGDVMGCTNPKATNYNKDATKDDGTCKLPVDPKPVLGCTNPKATNYNKDATKDDGTCKLPPVVVEEELQVISLPNDLATEGKEYTYQPIVTSDKKVSYKLLENPEGMTIDKNTGLVKWLPTSEGKVKVVIEMTTGTKTITQSFTINVRAGYGNIQMAQVHLYPEEVSAGDYVTLYVDLKNDGDKDYENLNVRAHIYDLNLQRTSGQFDLDRGDATTKAIYLDVPYWAEAGEYTMVVSVSNSDFHSTVYRYITIK